MNKIIQIFHLCLLWFPNLKNVNQISKVGIWNQKVIVHLVRCVKSKIRGRICSTSETVIISYIFILSNMFWNSNLGGQSKTRLLSRLSIIRIGSVYCSAKQTPTSDDGNLEMMKCFKLVSLSQGIWTCRTYTRKGWHRERLNSWLDYALQDGWGIDDLALTCTHFCEGVLTLIPINHQVLTSRRRWIRFVGWGIVSLSNSGCTLLLHSSQCFTV